jgi:hypothetical protein
MVNSEELIVTTEHLMLYMSCSTNRCRYNRVLLYFDLWVFCAVSCVPQLTEKLAAVRGIVGSRFTADRSSGEHHA